MKFTAMALVFLFACNFAKAQDDTPTAESILNAAYLQADKENKNIILLFHASWCGWCRKMDAAMNDKSCKKLFDENYVTVHLTVEESKDKKYLENAGGDLIKKKYHEEEAGLPFWVILDKNGKLLADSYIRKAGIPKDQPGENMGCPTSEKEVAAFIEILRKTSSLTEKQLDKISDRFSKNKPIPPAH